MWNRFANESKLLKGTAPILCYLTPQVDVLATKTGLQPRLLSTQQKHGADSMLF